MGLCNLVLHLNRLIYDTYLFAFPYQADEELTYSRNLPAASLRSLLTHSLDISSPPTQPLLQSLISHTTDKQKVGELISLSQVGFQYSLFINIRACQHCDGWCRHSNQPLLIFQSFISTNIINVFKGIFKITLNWLL